MKTVRFLEHIDDNITVGSIFTISDTLLHKINQVRVELEILPEDEKASILPSDAFPLDAIRKKKNPKPEIQLPHKEMDLTFVTRLAEEITALNLDLFFEPTSLAIVEISEWYDPKRKFTIFGKRFVDALRFKSIIEGHFSFWKWEYNKKISDFEKVAASPTKGIIEYAMKSTVMWNSLRKCSAVFESPSVYVGEKGDLKVTKRGYNEEYQCYVKKDAPEVTELDVTEAKSILDECLLDFPFQTDQDKIAARAAIITPMLRGIYQRYGTRAPVFAYLANQQGCGKDYCAGIRHQIYMGRFIEESPLSNDKGSNSDEVQKDFVVHAQQGDQFMHNSNCRGHLQNAAYEKQVTSSVINGRVLGSSIHVNSENILENSLSGNYGLTFNRDIARRIVLVNLFTEVEDTTKRTFQRDLHAWIQDNRSRILSAIYTLIKSWWDAGHKDGKGVNASYPLWAKICSGVMEYHELGNPCEASAKVINDVGGDIETSDIAQMNRELGDWLYDPENIIKPQYDKHKREGLTKKEIFTLFAEIYKDADDRPFAKYNLDDPKDRREFGRTVNKTVGTYRGGYKLTCTNYSEKIKLDRLKYQFVKFVVPTVPTVPVSSSPHTDPSKCKTISDEPKVDPVGTVGTKLTSIPCIISSLEEKYGRYVPLCELKDVALAQGWEKSEYDLRLADLRGSGDIFEPKVGWIARTA